MDPNTPATPPPPPPLSPAPQPPPVMPAALVQPVIVERKSPGLAGFLSFFPGLGHLYLGLYQRAFAFAGAFCTSGARRSPRSSLLCRARESKPTSSIGALSSWVPTTSRCFCSTARCMESSRHHLRRDWAKEPNGWA